MSRKILYISGTRADYGLMRSVLHRIHNHPELSLEIVVTGMHLMDEFGHTINEIRKDGFSCHIVDVKYEEDTPEAMAIFIGRLIEELTPVVRNLQPNIILLLGDRGEMLAGAIVGTYMKIPVAHLQGGELSSTVDDLARHAITKLANIHFPATQESKDRIIRMGEDPSRIFVVGAPGLDQIQDESLLSREELEEKYQLDFSKPVTLVVQHPVTLESDDAGNQIRETLEAIVSFEYQTIVIFPNADAGGREMIHVLREYEHYPFIKMYKSLPHKDYLSLLKHISIIVGNSSSGIIEAPSFGIPAINIGTRQRGRERALNVIDTDYGKDAIIKSIRTALSDKNFRKIAEEKINPYGDGKTSERIITILATIDINKNLLTKIMK